MASKITEEYRTERIAAYDVAIDSLRGHYSDSDIPGLSASLREELAAKLEREIQRWVSGLKKGSK